jgi:hypothetical protein
MQMRRISHVVVVIAEKKVNGMSGMSGERRMKHSEAGGVKYRGKEVIYSPSGYYLSRSNNHTLSLVLSNSSSDQQVGTL